MCRDQDNLPVAYFRSVKIHLVSFHSGNDSSDLLKYHVMCQKYIFTNFFFIIEI